MSQIGIRKVLEHIATEITQGLQRVCQERLLVKRVFTAWSGNRTHDPCDCSNTMIII